MKSKTDDGVELPEDIYRIVLDALNWRWHDLYLLREHPFIAATIADVEKAMKYFGAEPQRPAEG
jgi:hypothetical protein